MVLGISLSTFTQIHVVISSVGIASGIIVLAGMVGGHRFAGWTALFLTATALTSLTGFLFPFTHITPAHVVGVISLVVLAIAMLALYVYQLSESWRWVYLASAVLALYPNVFVGVVQAFRKLPFLTRLAPTQAEPPFLIA